MATMQEAANELGRQIRDLHNACNASGSQTLAAKSALLHDTMAQAFVDHLMPLGLDWDQVAMDDQPQGKSVAQPQAGVKTKPEASN